MEKQAIKDLLHLYLRERHKPEADPDRIIAAMQVLALYEIEEQLNHIRQSLVGLEPS